MLWFVCSSSDTSCGSPPRINPSRVLNNALSLIKTGAVGSSPIKPLTQDQEHTSLDSEPREYNNSQRFMSSSLIYKYSAVASSFIKYISEFFRVAAKNKAEAKQNAKSGF
jgi:hypothetical protein